MVVYVRTGLKMPKYIYQTKNNIVENVCTTLHVRVCCYSNRIITAIKLCRRRSCHSLICTYVIINVHNPNVVVVVVLHAVLRTKTVFGGARREYYTLSVSDTHILFNIILYYIIKYYLAAAQTRLVYCASF